MRRANCSMPPDPSLILLEQVREAAAFVLEQTREVSFSQYCGDRIKRAVVERYFITIGEALNRLAQSDPATASRIDNVPRIIAFRNRIVHGYDQIDNAI